MKNQKELYRRRARANTDSGTAAFFLPSPFTASGADILSVEAVIRFVFSLEPRAPTERTASRSNARRFESAVSNRASRRRPLVTPSRLASDDASASTSVAATDFFVFGNGDERGDERDDAFGTRAEPSGRRSSPRDARRATLF